MERLFMFSIIVICYNEQNTIEMTLNSIARQEFSDYECIVIDGASEDSTVSKIKCFVDNISNMKFISESDDGIYDAMNKGIKMSKGKYLNFLNAGDKFHNEYVLGNVAQCITNNHCDILIGCTDLIEYNRRIRTDTSRAEDLREYLSDGKGFCHQSIFAHKNTLKDGFDTEYKIAADYDWLCKQVVIGKTVYQSNLIISDYDVHGVSSQYKTWKTLTKENHEIIEKCFPKEKMKFSLPKEMNATKIRAMFRLANDWLSLRQTDRELTEYFMKNGFFSIAIYGAGYLGQRLYDELACSNVKVVYFIDEKEDVCNKNTRVYHLQDALPDVDAIVVTPIIDFFEIETKLSRRINCHIISLEDIIAEMHKYGV